MVTSLADRFKASLPTLSWRKQLREGSEFFTEAAIADSEATLGRFLERLDAAAGDQTAMLPLFQEAVLAFDALNDQHDYFVETMEREELAQFFIDVADAVGLEHQGDEVTEQWRTNW